MPSCTTDLFRPLPVRFFFSIGSRLGINRHVCSADVNSKIHVPEFGKAARFFLQAVSLFSWCISISRHNSSIFPSFSSSRICEMTIRFSSLFRFWKLYCIFIAGSVATFYLNRDSKLTSQPSKHFGLHELSLLSTST